MFIAGMLCTVFGQQGLLNAAMALGPIMTVFPIFQVLGRVTVFPIFQVQGVG
jgi:hypothetical protein